MGEEGRFREFLAVLRKVCPPTTTSGFNGQVKMASTLTSRGSCLLCERERTICSDPNCQATIHDIYSLGTRHWLVRPGMVHGSIAAPETCNTNRLRLVASVRSAPNSLSSISKTSAQNATTHAQVREVDDDLAEGTCAWPLMALEWPCWQDLEATGPSTMVRHCFCTARTWRVCTYGRGQKRRVLLDMRVILGYLEFRRRCRGGCEQILHFDHRPCSRSPAFRGRRRDAFRRVRERRLPSADDEPDVFALHEGSQMRTPC